MKDAHVRILTHVKRRLDDLPPTGLPSRASLVPNPVVTLCGSARFENWFHLWNKALTLAGNTVFSLTAFPSVEGKKVWYSEEEKAAMDEAHLRKIELSDFVAVINRYGYLGESTLREIEYARELGKTLCFMESWGKGYGPSGADAVERMSALGIETYGSPIDTHQHLPITELLGPAGSLRSSLVVRIDEEKGREGGRTRNLMDAPVVLQGGRLRFQWTCPNRCRLIGAGGFDPDLAVDLVTPLMGDLIAEDNARSHPLQPGSVVRLMANPIIREGEVVSLFTEPLSDSDRPFLILSLER